MPIGSPVLYFACAGRFLSLCSYGPGEYSVGVVSKGIPARFALRVSAASPADEVSTHMRTAAAIVDNLAIMSNMDPHVRGWEERVTEREKEREVGNSAVDAATFHVLGTWYILTRSVSPP